MRLIRDLLNKQFFCNFKVQHFTGLSIDPVLDFLNDGAGAFAYITSLGDEPANHPVDILVTAPLSGRIGMRTIELDSCQAIEYRRLQCRVIKELATLVCCDGLEHDFERLLPIERSMPLMARITAIWVLSLILRMISFRLLHSSRAALPIPFPRTTRSFSQCPARCLSATSSGRSSMLRPTDVPRLARRCNGKAGSHSTKINVEP